MADKLSIHAGDLLQLEAVWSSASDSIAKVSESGRVTAVSPGTVEIYCTVLGLSVATVVQVIAAPTPVPEEGEDSHV